MIEHQPKQRKARQRALSAKAPSLKSRPLSGMTNRNNQRTEIEQVYTGIRDSPIRKHTSKTFVMQGISTDELAKFKKQSTVVTSKKKQQLFEENMVLKKEVNRLNENYAILKGKLQTRKRKMSQHHKQINMEFEKQLYWGGSKAHLISGIKHQYEKLKKEYSLKCRQYEEIKRNLLQTKIPEHKIYAQNIEIENQRLQEKVKYLLMSRSQTSQSKKIDEALYAESQNEKKKLQRKLQELDLKLRAVNENLSDRDKKILFLEKLIIQKDNRQYHANQRVRRVQKLKEEVLGENKKLKQEIKELQLTTQKKINETLEDKEKQIRIQREKYEKQISSYKRVLAESEDENRYLESVVNKLKISSSLVEVTRTPKQQSKLSIPSENKNQIFSLNMTRSQKERTAQEKKKKVTQKSSQQKIEEKRQMKRANIKHTQNGVKCRPVEKIQVTQIGELLRYKLLGENIPYQKVKDLLQYQENELISSEEEELWNRQYISMGEVQKRLQLNPFCLCHDDALLLSRYMVEDCTEEHVYWDQSNQNKRQLVKSILRNLIGWYEIGEREEVQYLYQEVMIRNKSNLSEKLHKLYPAGLISMSKLMEMFEVYKVDYPPSFMPLLIGKLAIRSNSLRQLRFGEIFE